jgi:formylaminopyrimidine deformylase / aminopyrimidine aminohydrolase
MKYNFCRRKKMRKRGNMHPSDLLHLHHDAWNAATRHPFLTAVREGTIDPNLFAIWLVQDYLFVKDELTCQARLLARAPRSAQNLLVESLRTLEAELSWFEAHANQQNFSLDMAHLATTAAYRDFFQELEHTPYALAITAIWAVERAYLESWQFALPGHPTYQAYIEHWANPLFEGFVGKLEHAAATALETSDKEKEVESAFLRVAHLERDFWDMAWYGGAQ